LPLLLPLFGELPFDGLVLEPVGAGAVTTGAGALVVVGGGAEWVVVAGGGAELVVAAGVVEGGGVAGLGLWATLWW
jgi:hypothetical protein